MIVKSKTKIRLFSIIALTFTFIITLSGNRILAFTPMTRDGYEDSHMSIKSYGSTFYTNRLVQAANYWNATGTLTQIVVYTDSLADVPNYMTVSDGGMYLTRDGEYYAITTASDGVSASKFEIWVNSHYNPVGTSLTDYHQVESTIVHEFGNALWLNDTTGTAFMNESKVGSSLYKPQQDDIDGVDAKWPW